MKNYSDSNHSLSSNSSAKRKSRKTKKLCLKFKKKCFIKPTNSENLPPDAPHNTTQFIMKSHSALCNDIEELFGSSLILLEIQV